MSLEITKLMLIPVNNLCYLIKRLSLFPACVIYSPFVALSIFVVLPNFCRIIKLLPSWGIELFFLGVYISLVISQDIPSCETFSRAPFAILRWRIRSVYAMFKKKHAVLSRRRSPFGFNDNTEEHLQYHSGLSSPTMGARQNFRGVKSPSRHLGS